MKDTDIIAAIAPDAVSLMDKAIAEIKRLKEGYEGSCYACEPVGIKNLELENEIERLRKEVVSLTDELEKLERDKFEHGGAWGSYFGK